MWACQMETCLTNYQPRAADRHTDKHRRLRFHTVTSQGYFWKREETLHDREEQQEDEEEEVV